MLAGQPPFTGPTATAILGKVVGENARPIVEHRRSVPPHVSDAIAKALEKLPADRWQSASEFVDALRERPAAIDLSGSYPSNQGWTTA